MYSVFPLTSNRLEQTVSCLVIIVTLIVNLHSSMVMKIFLFQLLQMLGKIFSKLVRARENSIADIVVNIVLES